MFRGIGERFMVGDDVIVTIMGIRGNNIKMGVDSPPEIPVTKSEHYYDNRERVDNDASEDKADTEILFGHIETIFDDKGFGFIRSSEAQEPIFFHASELMNKTFKDVFEGDKVRFIVGKREKGAFAKKIMIEEY